MTVELVPDDATKQPLVVVDEPPAEPTFDDYAATLPATASGFLDDATPSPSTVEAGATRGGFLDDVATSDEPPAPRRKRKSLKKLEKTLKRMEESLANWPIAYFNNQALERPEWKLTPDEESLVRDAVETVFEVFDVGIDFDPIEYTITSPYLILLYPFAAFLVLFMVKKQASNEREQKEQATS
jgi:hypothetical protein